jgi:type I restriction-modification system DNA methylase subunit
MSQQNLSLFIWSAADLLRGDYKQSKYGKDLSPVSTAVTSKIDVQELAYQETV